MREGEVVPEKTNPNFDSERMQALPKENVVGNTKPDVSHREQRPG